MEQMEQIVNHVENRVRSLGENEVSTNLIGEYVMEDLVDLDEIAYIRFASVYRQFKDMSVFLKSCKISWIKQKKIIKRIIKKTIKKQKEAFPWKMLGKSFNQKYLPRKKSGSAERQQERLAVSLSATNRRRSLEYLFHPVIRNLSRIWQGPEGMHADLLSSLGCGIPQFYDARKS